MVKTESTMVPVGTPAPEFNLPDPAGTTVSLHDYAGRPVVVAFVCNHCPYVKHIAADLPDVVSELESLGVGFVAINSNADTHPDDSPAAMTSFAREHGWRFPYLVDGSQEVAKDYRAACTPDFFVFGADHLLAYRGQMDDSRPDGTAVTGADLLAAARHVAAGEPVPEPHHPSMGCNIKWKPGNEPEYFG
ncbi:MAG: thioredoxin family protein [Acidimicrobiales bacterium]|nr:thioredoxin family protein [Acidimicrobiales bacterium]